MLAIHYRLRLRKRSTVGHSNGIQSRPKLSAQLRTIVGRTVYRSWPFVLPLLIAPPTAYAQNVKILPVIEVTAPERQSVPKVKVPAAVYKIDDANLRTLNVVNSEDALQQAPNMWVRKRFIGDNNALIAVRGTSNKESARTLVYADGLLLSNFLGSGFTFAPRWSMVAPEEIRQVDVIYGPYSALYPGNAIGATVLITTRMPSHLQTGISLQTFSQDFDLYDTGRSFSGVQGSAFLGDKVGRWSFLIDVQRLHNIGQPLSFYTTSLSNVPASPNAISVTGAQPYTSQKGAPGLVFGVNSEGMTRIINDQLKFKVAYDLTPEVRAAATVVHWHQSLDNLTGSYLRNAQGQLVSTGPVEINGKQYNIPANAFAPGTADTTHDLYGLSLRSQHPMSWNYSLVASLFNTGKDMAATAAGPGAGPGTVTYDNGDGWYTFDVRIDHRDSARQEGQWWSFGYHFDQYRLNSTTYNASDWQLPVLTDFNNRFAGDTRTQALYVQDVWYFAPGWKLTPGVRLERWNAFGGTRAQGNTVIRYADRSETHWSPKLALEHSLGEDWTARLSLAHAYRFPTVSELFQGQITGTELINNDPNLKPENDLARDLTFERTLDDSQLRLSVYVNDIRNTLISQTNTTVFPTITNIQNVAHVRTIGQEIAYRVQGVFLPSLNLDFSIAHNDTRTVADDQFPAAIGKHFYRIPLWRANAEVTYHQSNISSYSFSLHYSGRQYNSLDESDTHPDAFGGTSNFLTADAHADVSLGQYASLSVGIDNMTNRRYFVYHPYPGRTYYLKLRLEN